MTHSAITQRATMQHIAQPQASCLMTILRNIEVPTHGMAGTVLEKILQPHMQANREKASLTDGGMMRAIPILDIEKP